MALRIPLFFGVLLLCGCSTIYRTEIPTLRSDTQSSGAIDAELPLFWAANGFQREGGGPGSCTLLAPAERRDVDQRTVACWRRSYPGWLVPYSGHLFGVEAVENGIRVIYIYSNGREHEAAEAAENLKLFLHARHPDIEIVQMEKDFVDVR